MSDFDVMTDAQYWAFLHSACTWRYDCTANALCGFDCTLFAADRSTVEFPAVARPGPGHWLATES